MWSDQIADETSLTLQHAYDKCRNRVVHTVCQDLMSGLFSIVTNTPEKQGTLDLEGASRGFGLLLHAFALKTERVKTEACAAISQEVCKYIGYCTQAAVLET